VEIRKMTNYNDYERQDLIKEIERLYEQRSELLMALCHLVELVKNTDSTSQIDVASFVEFLKKTESNL